MTMKKRVFSLLLAALLIVSLVSVSGFDTEAAGTSTIRAKKAIYYGDPGKTSTACEYEVAFVGKYNRLAIDIYDLQGKKLKDTFTKSYNYRDGQSGDVAYTLFVSSGFKGQTIVVKAKIQSSTDGISWYDATATITTTFVVSGSAGNYRNEWHNGQWYDANGSNSYSGVLFWKSDANGWYVIDTKGWYPRSEWVKIDGAWYYFTGSGYMDYGEYRDGYWLNGDGTCSNYPKASWYYGAGGWYYMDASGWYPANQYLWIDGVCYWFDGSGYTY